MSDKRTLLPISASILERHVEQSVARIEDVPVDPLHTIWNPETCAVELLPWLAWAVRVPEWSSNWPEQVKRDTISAAIIGRRKAGTAGAVKSALEAMGLNIELKEWFEQDPPGDPGTAHATLQLKDFGLPENDSKLLDRVIDATKNVRSHLTLDIAITSVHSSGFKGVPVLGEEITVTPYTPTELVATDSRALRLVHQSSEIIEVTPEWTNEVTAPCEYLKLVSQTSEVITIRPPRAVLTESWAEFLHWYDDLVGVAI